MGKNGKTLLLAGVVVVGVFLVYRWYTARKATGTTPALGSNLNSLAPELVAGSSGPRAGGVDIPVHVFVTETITRGDRDHGDRDKGVNPGPPMLGANNTTPSPLSRATTANGQTPGVIREV